MKLAILPILALVLISACVQEQQPVTEVSIPGHPVYTFSNDVREALQVKTSGSDSIRKLILESRRLTVVFDGSDEKDNGSFQVVGFNVVTKLQTYFVWEGQILSINSYYHIGDNWFGFSNGTTTQIEKPSFSGPVVWMKGPSTGANETSLTLDNSTITLQGLDHKGLTLAGDKLSLIVLGIEKV